ncbi:hypothetical protein [Saccharothrix hoggarensis]|uniref:Uncharacterized protein n=1 Tax=Saccharothrix hoggarensis TaxID=913853 RepID=A0ABW3QWC3_9PSEU
MARSGTLLHQDWVRLLTFGGLVLVVVLVELASGTVREFYVEHPLQAGIATGAMLTIAVYFGLDAVRAELAQRRWNDLSLVAFKALASETTLVIDKFLWVASGAMPTNESRPSDADARKLRNTLRRHSLPGRPAVDIGGLKHKDYKKDLNTLFHDAGWRAFAEHQLDRSKWRNRQGIAVWAASMLATNESADVLNRMASLNEWISGVQAILKTPDPTRPQQLEQEWMDWLAEALSLREDLMRAAQHRIPEVYKDFREVLDKPQVTALAKHDGDTDKHEILRNLVTPLKHRDPSAIPGAAMSTAGSTTSSSPLVTILAVSSLALVTSLVTATLRGASPEQVVRDELTWTCVAGVTTLWIFTWHWVKMWWKPGPRSHRRGAVLLAVAGAALLLLTLAIPTWLGSFSGQQPQLTSTSGQRTPELFTMTFTAKSDDLNRREEILIQVIGLHTGVADQAVDRCERARITEPPAPAEGELIGWQRSGPAEDGRVLVDVEVAVPANRFATVCAWAAVEGRDDRDRSDANARTAAIYLTPAVAQSP